MAMEGPSKLKWVIALGFLLLGVLLPLTVPGSLTFRPTAARPRQPIDLSKPVCYPPPWRTAGYGGNASGLSEG